MRTDQLRWRLPAQQFRPELDVGSQLDRGEFSLLVADCLVVQFRLDCRRKVAGEYFGIPVFMPTTIVKTDPRDDRLIAPYGFLCYGVVKF